MLIVTVTATMIDMIGEKVKERTRQHSIAEVAVVSIK